MKDQNKKRVVVSQRDKDLLVSLFKNKVLNLDQVCDFFFKGIARTTVCRRLNKLYDAELIEKIPYLVGNKVWMAYGISKLGVKLIQQDLPYEINRHYYVSDSIRHDIDLAGISKTFEGFDNVTEVYSESELLSVSEFSESARFRNFVSLRSDRMLDLNISGKKFDTPLEYERTLKTRKRVEKKFSDYYLYQHIEVVLYVCKDQSTINSMMRIDLEVCKDQPSKMHFCLLDEVSRGGRPLLFTNSKKAQVKLL